MTGHLLGPVGSVLVQNVHYGAVNIEKDKYLPLFMFRKLHGYHTETNTVDISHIEKP